MSRVFLAVWLAVTAARTPHQLQPPAQTEWITRNVIRWLPLVERWHGENPELDPAWILAVIAQESMGESDVIGGDRVGSVGLMQIAPFEWRPSTSELQNPSVNISWGMSILGILNERYSGNMRFVLASYNCGEEGVRRGHCGKHGGYAYAAVVLDYWTPLFRQALHDLMDGEYADLRGWMQQFYPDRDLYGWLAELGYDNGLGNWQREESVIERLLGKLLAHFGVRIE